MKRYASLLMLVLLGGSQLYSQNAQQRQKQLTWYESVARQVNADDTDYGSIWEQRKQEFISQLRNSYFRYALATTGVAVLLGVMLFALYVRHRRTLEVMVQAIADVRRHDEYARRLAREATRRYNEHIEFCNRVIEGDESGLWKWMSGAEINAIKRERQQTIDELISAQREIRQLKEELDSKTAAIAEMSLRLKDTPRHVPQTRKPSDPASPAHIERINQLELELVDERKKNLRFKGGALDVHNG
jgi:hypothetical protein